MSTETKTLTNADAKIQPKLGVKALVQIGMLSAIAIILMMFEIPLPFAPTFYKIDLSEVPVLDVYKRQVRHIVSIQMQSGNRIF